MTLKMRVRKQKLALGRGVSIALAAALCISGCGGGGTTGGSTPLGGSPSPSASQSAGPINSQPSASPSGSPQSAYACPASAPASVARGGTASSEDIRRMPSPGDAFSEAGEAGRLAVTYDRSDAGRAVARGEAAAGVRFEREFVFPRLGLVTRIVTVTPAAAAHAAALLRAQPGVRAVAPVGGRRYPLTVAQPLFPSDPYFNGFATTLPPAPGATAPPPTFHVAPFDESANVPGQWDMHAVRLEYAFAYSRTGNEVPANPGALGTPSVKVAIIDTGEDAAHPDLGPKIAYQKCFITSPQGATSTGGFANDPQGHGTDVAGLAAAETGNAFGFAAAGGNVRIAAYRVFPTPDDSCASETLKDTQCGASPLDIAAAIEDAVAQKAGVISLSLGGSPCNGGQDPDAVEGQAVADAIAAGKIIIAAAGNSATAALDSPACDPGVIAVGATALADGQPNGAGNSNGSAASPIEYVASYSNYGSPGAKPKNASAWGIVAPGGDPQNAYDADDLHWVENIWTTTPFMSSAADTNFAGSCQSDYGTIGPIDCKILIAGTSQAAPHVAGVAALVLSVNASYQSAAAMKGLLCSTADDIGDIKEGCGRLNAYRAMAKALGDPAPP
jgi:subtilisin family serine protease